MAEVIVTIRPDGTVETTVEGVEGPGCADLLAPFDRALGVVRERKRTPAYNRSAGVRPPRRQETGR